MVEELDAGGPSEGQDRRELATVAFFMVLSLGGFSGCCWARLPGPAASPPWQGASCALCSWFFGGLLVRRHFVAVSGPGWLEAWASLASWGAGFRRRRAAAAVVLWGLLLAGVCLRFERAEWGYYLGVVRWPPARVGARRGAKAWQPSSKGPLSVFG